jgi:DNA-binding beta-propeller fold protein YncE
MIYGSGEYKYELVEGWAKPDEGDSLLDIGGISIDRNDRVYIFNRSKHPIQAFDSEGNLQKSWGEGHFKQPHGSCIGPDGSIYCTDDRRHMVTKFDCDGNILMEIGAKDKPSDSGYRDVKDLFERISSITKGGGPFNRPTSIALSSSGDLYVADGYGNARVHKFRPDGKHIFSWGEPGTRPGQFRLPHSVFVDRRDRVWVVDRENSRIQIFDDRGNFLNQWTDHLIRPTDIFIDDNETVYVSELCNRVSIFSIDGRLITSWGNESHASNDPLFVTPHAISVDSKGNLYIGEVSFTYLNIDRGPKTIQKFARI